MTVETLPDIEQLNLEDVVPYEDSEDPNTRTHIVSPPENKHITNGLKMSAQDIVDTARITGAEVVALCGYKWVPKHNPEMYPGCQACFKIAELLMSGRGE